MSKYRVFLGAPDVPTVLNEVLEGPAVPVPASRKWAKSQVSFPHGTPLPPRIESQPPLSALGNNTTGLDISRVSGEAVSSTRSGSPLDSAREGPPTPSLDDNRFFLLPEKTFHDASRRLSKLYAGVIFGDEDRSKESGSIPEAERGSAPWNTTGSDLESLYSSGEENEVGSVVLSGPRERRLLSQSQPGDETEESFPSTGDGSTRGDDEEDSFMEDETNTTTEGDSIRQFPTFHFNLHKLSSISSVTEADVRRRERRLVTFLVAILEVEGPSVVTTKSGEEMGLLKIIIGDETGNVSKVVVWRETALTWGGGEDRLGPGAMRKGDVVLLENVAVTYAPPTKPTLSVSPNERPSLTICYRTLPTERADRRFRPDLRLARTDAAMRRVAEVVKWVEGAAKLR